MEICEKTYLEIIKENKKCSQAMSGEPFNIAVLSNITLNKLKDILESKDNNYNFFWQSTFIKEKKKYKISEIPINLPARVIGSSKMKLKDLIIGTLNLIKFFIKYKIL